jgi:RNA-directed DNA polymerase
MSTTTNADLRERFARLRKATRSVTTLCALLDTDKHTLQRLGLQPRYKVFHLPKNEARDLRLIEDPAPVLKKVQSTLNFYLQSAYYFEKSIAGHAFVVNPVTDEDRRNILTNARKHLGRDWLLQLDLRDFFHHVTDEMVHTVYTAPPLCCTEQGAELLTGISTYMGRLPMGAPTSPVLSNFACRDLDTEMLVFAASRQWVYTRYADDLSFSAKKAFDKEDIAELHRIVARYGFSVNDQKTRLCGPDAEKIVTGILLRGKGALRPGFVAEIQEDTVQLTAVIKAQQFYGELRTQWVEKMKQQLRGKIAFSGFVLGKRNPDYINMKDAYYTAIAPPEENFGAVSWRGFHYLG